MIELGFPVVGNPAPQGSKRHIGHGRLVESSATAVHAWRAAVAAAATHALHEQNHPGFPAGPLRVYVIYWLHPPKALPKRVFAWPHRRPDLDKLTRATFDALTDAGVWLDDAQVVTAYLAKRYAHNGHPGTGATIRVRPELNPTALGT